MEEDADPEREFAALRRSYERIGQLLDLDPGRLGRVERAVSGWSADQHLAHLSLANELVARNLRSLLAGSGPLVREDGDPAPEVLDLLRRGVFPRGQAQAPRMVRPPEQVARPFLLEWVRDSARELEQLAVRAEDIPRATRRIPHQLLGPLTAAQWLRFAAIHTAHHLAIAEEVLATSADAPGR